MYETIIWYILKTRRQPTCLLCYPFCSPNILRTASKCLTCFIFVSMCVQVCIYLWKIYLVLTQFHRNTREGEWLKWCYTMFHLYTQRQVTFFIRLSYSFTFTVFFLFQFYSMDAFVFFFIWDEPDTHETLKFLNRDTPHILFFTGMRWDMRHKIIIPCYSLKQHRID